MFRQMSSSDGVLAFTTSHPTNRLLAGDNFQFHSPPNLDNVKKVNPSGVFAPLHCPLPHLPLLLAATLSSSATRAVVTVAVSRVGDGKEDLQPPSMHHPPSPMCIK